jgi:hypothetical protein
MRKSEKLLREIRRLVGLGWYRFTTHALDAMQIYRISSEEVIELILAATECTQDGERCRIDCVLETEVEIAVVIELQDEAVIVTVFEVIS